MNRHSDQLSVSGDFVLELSKAQPRLFGYALKRLGSQEQANELVQEVNLVLCAKADSFEPGTDFLAWAFTIARFQLMAYRKKQVRDRLVFADEVVDLIEELSADQEASSKHSLRQDALQRCMRNLEKEQQDILARRYVDASSVKAIAADRGTTANAVSLVLHRARQKLMKCIELRVANEFQS